MAIVQHPAQSQVPRTPSRTPLPTPSRTPPAAARRTDVSRAIPLGVGVIVGVTGAFWLLNGGLAQLGQTAGGWLAVGQLTGIIAALAALAGLILVARPTWLERSVGMDTLWAWHRLAGIITVFALLGHAFASSVGFAGGSVGDLVSEVISLMGSASWMVAAVVAAVMYLVIAGSSWRRIRTRMTYETWLALHVGGYLAVLLGFGHQITMGHDFSGTEVTTTLARLWWIGLFAATALVILWSRVGDILRSFTTGRATVVRVVPAARGSVAIEMRVSGRRLRAARAGQFFMLRVLTRDLWWQSHPISLSARPHDGLLRFTVGLSGDGSRQMATVRPGTRVALEGPYGIFTADRAGSRPVVLFGGGVGLTVIRAVLADCTPAQSPVVVARVSATDQIPHADELRRMTADRGGRFIVVAGSRRQWPHSRPFAPELLVAGIPDIASRDAFICGPPGMERDLERSLRSLDLREDRIHLESFGV